MRSLISLSFVREDESRAGARYRHSRLKRTQFVQGVVFVHRNLRLRHSEQLLMARLRRRTRGAVDELVVVSTGEVAVGEAEESPELRVKPVGSAVISPTAKGSFIMLNVVGVGFGDLAACWRCRLAWQV